MGNGYQPGTIPARSLVDREVGEPVNRAFFIILTPALLVAAGYIIVFRYIGLAAGYARLIVASILFFGMIYWLSQRSGRETNSKRV